MLNFCDFIPVYVFTTNHHLKLLLLIIFKMDTFLLKKSDYLE